MSRPLRNFAAALAVILAAAAAPAAARADGGAPAVAGPPSARYVPGQVVVQYASQPDDARVVNVPRAQTLSAAKAIAHSPGVLSARPNYVAKISGFVPRDPGRSHTRRGWEHSQWNFLAADGVDALDAWQHLIAAGRPGGSGVVVAVLDTGIAYENRGRFRRSPDFSANRFVRGADFVDSDRHPDDENGHGTHVASTIAEGTNNSIGMTGLAYGVKLMPVRVLDRDGEGGSADIADGIRWAANHGAKVINLSFEFGPAVSGSDIPDILSALRHARRKGALVVGAAGNAAAEAVAYPARASNVLSVGATTSHRCLAEYSNEGVRLDLVAPGGGADADISDDPNCDPPDLGGPAVGRPIYQMTLAHACGSHPSFRRFSIPSCFIGTSMAAPHATATAALVIASGVLGPHPSPAAVAARLEQTARDLGATGRDSHYGWGLLDAGRATDPAVP